METETVQPPVQNHTETGAVQNNAETQNETLLNASPDASAEPQTDAAKPEEQAPKGAPDSYEFAMPEGFTLDADVADKFSAIAKAHSLSQEDAQTFADLAVELVAKTAESHQAMIANATREWQQQSLSDSEFGGAALKENLSLAERAINQFNPELYSVLKQSGLGNHPELIRFAYRVGKAIAEDRIETGKDGAPSVQDPERIMYPTMFKK